MSQDQLVVLIVESEAIQRECLAKMLEWRGISAKIFESSVEALEELRVISSLRLPIDIITSDVIHPRSHGVRFLRRVRDLPDDDLAAGGLRIKYTPFLFNSAVAVHHYRDEISRIDSGVDILDKGSSPHSFDFILQRMFDAIGNYRHNIIAELEHLGIGVVWESGCYRLVSACAIPPHIETKFFSGTAHDAGESYTRIVLITSQSKFSRLALDMFQELINMPGVTERDVHKFFDRHPEFLLDGGYDTYWSDFSLSPGATEKFRPDFILQPLGRRHHPHNWTIVDLKRLDKPLIVNERFHPDFSKSVYQLIAQLRNYGEFFQDPRNEKYLRQRFGGVVPRPKLVGIIGRMPRNTELFAKLKKRIADVDIITYDELIEFRKARADFLAKVGL